MASKKSVTVVTDRLTFDCDENLFLMTSDRLYEPISNILGKKLLVSKDSLPMEGSPQMIKAPSGTKEGTEVYKGSNVVNGKFLLDATYVDIFARIQGFGRVVGDKLYIRIAEKETCFYNDVLYRFSRFDPICYSKQVFVRPKGAERLKTKPVQMTYRGGVKGGFTKPQSLPNPGSKFYLVFKNDKILRWLFSFINETSIPGFIFDAPLHLRKAFVQGSVEGSEYICKTNLSYCRSMQRLLHSMKIFSTISEKDKQYVLTLDNEDDKNGIFYKNPFSLKDWPKLTLGSAFVNPIAANNSSHDDKKRSLQITTSTMSLPALVLLNLPPLTPLLQEPEKNESGDDEFTSLSLVDDHFSASDAYQVKEVFKDSGSPVSVPDDSLYSWDLFSFSKPEGSFCRHGVTFGVLDR